MGYHRAGFDVYGVDIAPQPNYPFEFYQGDAMTWPLDGFDAIHASPPCQAYSVATLQHRATNTYPDLVAPIRSRLAATGLPYVIENVPGAPLLDAVQVLSLIPISEPTRRTPNSYAVFCLPKTGTTTANATKS